MLKRGNHAAAFRPRVALEAVKDERTMSELATAYAGLHPAMIHPWRKALPKGTTGIFERGGKVAAAETDEDTAHLHARIGELAVASDFYRESSSHGPASEG